MANGVQGAPLVGIPVSGLPAGWRPGDPVPFRLGTRRRTIGLETKNFVDNGLVEFIMPSTGYAGSIYLLVKGVLRRTFGDTGAALSTSWADFLQRIQVETNIGTGVIIDVQGSSLHFHQWLQREAFGGQIGGAGSTAPVPTDNGPYTYPIPGAPGTADLPFVYQFRIPLASNQGVQFDAGLINVQATQVQMKLRINCGTVANLFPAGSVLAGTSFLSCQITPTFEAFQVPAPGTGVVIPRLAVHKLLTDSKRIAMTGDFVYEALKEGRLMRMMHQIYNGGVLDDGMFTNFVTSPAAFQLTKGEIWINASDRVEERNRYMWDRMWHEITGTNPINGVKVWDFWNAWNQNGQSDDRDTFDLTQISQFESRLNFQGTLGAPDTNYVVTTREIFQPLQ